MQNEPARCSLKQGTAWHSTAQHSTAQHNTAGRPTSRPGQGSCGRAPTTIEAGTARERAHGAWCDKRQWAHQGRKCAHLVVESQGLRVVVPVLLHRQPSALKDRPVVGPRGRRDEHHAAAGIEARQELATHAQRARAAQRLHRRVAAVAQHGAVGAQRERRRRQAELGDARLQWEGWVGGVGIGCGCVAAQRAGSTAERHLAQCTPACSTLRAAPYCWHEVLLLRELPAEPTCVRYSLFCVGSSSRRRSALRTAPSTRGLPS